MPLRPPEPVLEEQSKLSSTAMRDTRHNKKSYVSTVFCYILFFNRSNSFQCHDILKSRRILTERSDYCHFLTPWGLQKYNIELNLFTCAVF